MVSDDGAVPMESIAMELDFGDIRIAGADREEVLDRMPIRRIATMFEELISAADLGVSLYQFIEDNQ